MVVVFDIKFIQITQFLILNLKKDNPKFNNENEKKKQWVPDQDDDDGPLRPS